MIRAAVAGALVAGVVAVAGAATPAAVPAPLGACGPVGRRYEAVEISGAELRRLGGTPLERFGVIAFRGGHAQPIPFQMDEKRGRKLALDSGPEANADDKPGVFDVDDVVVFMACDAGAGTWREVRLEDPLTHTRAWVYVVAADRPPATPLRYVAYDTAGDLVTAARYRIGMVDALPTYFALASGAGVGPNLIDGLRLRADARLRADLAHWALNERQGRHELIAWRAGPVRVVRRSRHQVVIGLGIHLTAGLAHTYFYPQHVYGPGSLKLPFSPGILFREITAYGGVDCRDLRGWRYHAPGTPAGGLHIDGHMDDVESHFASSGDWFVLEHGDQAILFVTRMSENLRRSVPLSLLYRDDAARPNPPEDVPGTVPLVGYQARDIEKLSGGRYTFALHIFTLVPYRTGDERTVIAQLDAPVTREVTADGTLSDRGAPGGAPGAAR